MKISKKEFLNEVKQLWAEDKISQSAVNKLYELAELIWKANNEG